MKSSQFSRVTLNFGFKEWLVHNLVCDHNRKHKLESRNRLILSHTNHWKSNGNIPEINIHTDTTAAGKDNLRECCKIVSMLFEVLTQHRTSYACWYEGLGGKKKKHFFLIRPNFQPFIWFKVRSRPQALLWTVKYECARINPLKSHHNKKQKVIWNNRCDLHCYHSMSPESQLHSEVALNLQSRHVASSLLPSNHVSSEAK